MKIFLTGATGTIGAEVARALTGDGHVVTALLRSPGKRHLLEALGARAHGGDLADSDSYASEAARHDVLIHAAMDYAGETVAADRVAIDTFVGALQGGGRARRFLYTSGCWVLGDTGGAPAAEDAGTDGAAPLVRWRPAHERAVLEAGRGTASTVVLRPGLVYGGPGSLTAGWYRAAASGGAAPLIGDGQNHWSFVHVEDLARLYVAVAGSDAGGVFHGVDNAPVLAADAVAAASRAAGAGGRVKRLSLEEGRASLGPVADALVMDQQIVTERAEEVGWEPACASYPDCVERAFAEWLAFSRRRTPS